MNETGPMSAPQDPHAPTEWTPSPVWSAPTGPVSFTTQGSGGGGRRRVLRAAMVLVPALVVVAGASSIITLAVAGDHTTSSGSGRPAGAGGAADHTTVGTLTDQSGSSWQLRTARGKTVTVHVAPSTTFGTKAHPSTADAFHTGTTVRVLGTVQGATVDATRIVGVDRPAATPSD